MTPKSMGDESAFVSSIGVASLMQLLDDYGHILADETEEVFEDAKERLLRFEEAQL